MVAYVLIDTQSPVTEHRTAVPYMCCQLKKDEPRWYMTHWYRSEWYYRVRVEVPPGAQQRFGALPAVFNLSRALEYVSFSWRSYLAMELRHYPLQTLKCFPLEGYRDLYQCYLTVAGKDDVVRSVMLEIRCEKYTLGNVKQEERRKKKEERRKKKEKEERRKKKEERRKKKEERRKKKEERRKKK